ncbi:MAG: alpha/beta hydrolase [Gammaproteobacteria bacterium]|nr:alpha/beta hydrolase [Gammaproteobacteria bacterium]
MFSWDSERGGWGLFDIDDRERPLENIPEATRKLNELLTRIKQYRANKNSKKPFVLLAHSMGTIVLQKLVENEELKSWPSTEGAIFSNVVISSSDANNLGHEEWVQQIAATERTYVTFNNDDGTLKNSTEARPEGAVALGLNPGNKFANDANYINLTGLGMSISDQNEEDNDHHEMFNKCSMFNQVNMCQFYDSALKGNEPTLNSNIAEKNGWVYSLKQKIDKNDACFTNKCDFKKSQ